MAVSEIIANCTVERHYIFNAHALLRRKDHSESVEHDLGIGLKALYYQVNKACILISCSRLCNMGMMVLWATSLLA